MGHPAVVPIRRLLDALHDSAKRDPDASFELEVNGETAYDNEGRWGIRIAGRGPVPTGSMVVDAEAGGDVERESSLSGGASFRLVYRLQRIKSR